VEKLIALARGANVSKAVFKSECPLVSRDSVAPPRL
jgi:LacI family transcriptional regulator